MLTTIRFFFIKLLAGGSTIVLNAHVNGTINTRKTGLIAHNTFVRE